MDIQKSEVSSEITLNILEYMQYYIISGKTLAVHLSLLFVGSDWKQLVNHVILIWDSVVSIPPDVHHVLENYLKWFTSLRFAGNI